LAKCEVQEDSAAPLPSSILSYWLPIHTFTSKLTSS